MEGVGIQLLLYWYCDQYLVICSAFPSPVPSVAQHFENLPLFANQDILLVTAPKCCMSYSSTVPVRLYKQSFWHLLWVRLLAKPEFCMGVFKKWQEVPSLDVLVGYKPYQIFAVMFGETFFLHLWWCIKSIITGGPVNIHIYILLTDISEFRFISLPTWYT